MQVQIFSIPLSDTGDLQAEMNRFLATHRVLDVEQRFSDSGSEKGWHFCVRYLPADNGWGKALETERKKIDYRNVLSEKDFLVFSKLRMYRKELAQKDAVPAYAVFTDAELAGIAVLPEMTPSAMSTIKGIGEKKAFLF
ncbi:hypothetical protein IX335_001463 [Porphyromonas levii]|uniref:HRDC domain-containing protein n=1 Tax=Porphyromonas levii TaxID=28114 RepID=UPI001BA78249|nr:HRDC domain-containing protein [Porphyromonas levii]MBR8764236.1 hypothetical protein [Porphyromonas levii]